MSLPKLSAPLGDIPILGQGPAPNQQLVGLLEGLLAKAKTGELRSAAVAGATGKGEVTIAFHPGDVSAFLLLGGLDLVHRGLSNHIERLMTMPPRPAPPQE